MRGADSRVAVGKGRTVVRVGRPREAAQAPPKKVDRRALLSRLGSGALAVLMAAAVVYMLTGPTFQVANVEVTGQTLLKQAEVVQAAGVLGKSAFLVDRRQVASAIAGLATVSDVEVVVALPNTVKVRVQEYEPRYAWETPAGRYLVDERGLVLGASDGMPALPKVRDNGATARQRGDKVDLALLQAAARLAEVWPSSLGAVPVCEYVDGGLQLVGDGWRADLGTGADLEAKVLALRAVTEHAEAEGQAPAYFDLRLPERPYYK